MIRSRFGLPGLCLVMLGAIAFSASAAQAEVGAQWLFAEKGAGTNLVPFLEAALGFEADNTPYNLHTTIFGKALLVECKAISIENATLKANGSIGAGAKIKFGACIIKLNGVTKPECEPRAGKAEEKGVIRTNGLHALLQLHELAAGLQDSTIVFSPDSGKVWAVIEMGSECPLGSEIQIFGVLKAKDCENRLSTHLVKHLLEPGPGEGLWIIKNDAEHQITALVSWWVFLTGAHEGLKWSGLPA